MLELLSKWQEETKEHTTEQRRIHKGAHVKGHWRHYADHDTWIEEHEREYTVTIRTTVTVTRTK